MSKSKKKTILVLLLVIYLFKGVIVNINYQKIARNIMGNASTVSTSKDFVLSMLGQVINIIFWPIFYFVGPI
jgi:hypothetical protein